MKYSELVENIEGHEGRMDEVNEETRAANEKVKELEEQIANHNSD